MKTLREVLEKIKNENTKGILFVDEFGSEKIVPYSKLYNESINLLYYFQERGIVAGDKVLIQIQDDITYIRALWACVLGGIIAVPFDIAVNEEKKNQLLRICNILGNVFIVRDNTKNDSYISDEKCIEIPNKLPKTIKEINLIQRININEEDAVFYIFTSGSIGSPKGVILTNKNMISNLEAITKHYDINKNVDCSLSWMPFSHVLGLIPGHFVSVYAQINQVKLSLNYYLLDPKNWIIKASEHKVTLLYTTNFSLKQVIEKYTDNENSLDLSSVKMICVTAEPISLDICNQFVELFAKYGLKTNIFVPTYGMTEATGHITSKRIGEQINKKYILVSSFDIGTEIVESDEGIEVVSCGIPVEGCNVRICNDQNIRLKEKIFGNIQISGSAVTDEILNYDKGMIKRIDWYNTGDTGFICDGELYVIGRCNDIIIINGCNYYPQDIERIIEEIPEMKNIEFAVAGVKKPDEFEGIGVFIKNNNIDFDGIETKIRMRVNEKIGADIYKIINIEEIPKTKSGKVKRGELSTKVEIMTQIEHNRKNIVYSTKDDISNTLYTVKNIFSDVLQKPIERTDINFFSYGINSLKLIEISIKIKKAFNIKMDVGVLYKSKTIDKLVKEINFRYKNTNYVLPSLTFNMEVNNSNNQFPLTQIQQAYLVGRSNAMALGNISTQVFFQIKTDFNIKKLNVALNTLILQRESLRTIIKDNYQVVLSQVPKYQIAIVDLSKSNEEEIENKLQSEKEELISKILSYDRWPLFEIKAIKIKENCFYLLVKLDMLILDASSIDIFARELFELYANNNTGLKTTHTFKQYIEAYKKIKETELYEIAKKYWMDKLDSFPEAPILPMKKEISSIFSPHFKRKQFILSKEQWESLNTIAKSWNVTTSNILCAIYMALLSSWSNQKQLGISITSSNRYPVFEDVDSIMGDFTSIIPFATDVNTSKLFKDWVVEIQAQLFECLEHSMYDGVAFLRELAKRKNQFTEAMLPIVFTSMIESNHNNWKLLGKIENCITRTSQVLLDCQLSELDGNLHIAWDYVDEYFDEYTILSMFEQYIKLIEKLISNNTLSFMDFGVTENEYDLIKKYNESNENYELYPLHIMFEKEAKRNPNNIAVISNDIEMTYYELDLKSNQVANKLIQHGIQRQDMVGVIGARCKESLVNIMGILKAGACYIPIDPDYPNERIDYIIEKSGCKKIIGPEDAEDDELKEYSTENPSLSVELDDLAYVIFTSGSTGHPKGVVITHREAANTIIDINRKFSISNHDRILGISSMCFDLSVYDIFGTFAAGATLIQINDQRDVQELYDKLKRYNVTVWNSVPAIMEMMVQYINDNLLPYSCKRKISKSDKEKYYSSFKINIQNGKESEFYEYQDILTYLWAGRTIDEIENEYQNYPEKDLKELLRKLENLKLVQRGVSNPFEIFEGQERFIPNSNDEEIMCNPDCYEAFKEEQLNRRVYESKDKIYINSKNGLPKYISERESIRTFDKSRVIEKWKLEELLSALRQRRVSGEIKYYYPSAGGLYPLDIYIWIKKDSIEGMRQGLYYYCPVDNSLNNIFKSNTLTDEIHYYSNKNIFNTSNMSIFIVYNAQVTMPKYGSDAYFYACIDTGIVTQLITTVAELLGLSVCSIGKVDICKVNEYLELSSNQCLLHTIEIGYKSKKNNVLKEKTLVDKQISENLSNNLISESSSLRLVMLSGDWIPLNLPNKIKSLFNNSRIISLGGATEASIWSIYYPINDIIKDWKSIPYGYPLSNQKFYILDKNRNFCRINCVGEIYIGGIGVANGYLNDIEKTNDAFIEHPDLGRLYKTGDFGKLKAQGYIEFCGRRDSQVKINGYRIELGEIENCLEGFSGIKKAAVIDYLDERNKKYLAAYIVAENRISKAELKSYMSNMLPQYMLPSYYTFVDSIPLSLNGKVDKNKLPEPDFERSREYKEGEKLETKDMYEEQITEIWKDILGIQEVAINENFFDVGGTSMLLLQVFGGLNKIYPDILKITDLFSNPTIQKLAYFIKNKKSGDHKIYCELTHVNDNSFFRMAAEEICLDSYKASIELTNEMYNIALELKITPSDFMLAVFLFTLNQELKEPKIAITELQNKCFRKISVNFSELDTMEKLCNIVRNIKNTYSLDDLILDKKETNYIAIAYVDYKYFKSIISKKFDLILAWELSDVVTLHIKFDNKHYSNTRIKELFNDYIKVLCAYCSKEK